MALVQDAEGAAPDVGVVGVAREVGAGEPTVPRPLVLGVGRRVHADPAAARLDVALERVLLPRVEDVAGGVEEDDGAESPEVPFVERRGLLRRLDREAVLLPEPAQGGDAGLDRAVAKSGGP